METAKTLFISDLDGTLMNSEARVSDKSAELLNKIIDKGCLFTAATARTAATAVPILSGININVPVILMNGVCIYDIEKSRYVNIEQIDETSCRQLFGVLKDFHLSGFVFSITGNVLMTFYENVDSPNAKKFVEERTRKFGKVFTHTDNFCSCIEQGVIYYSVTDTKEILDPVYDAIKGVDGIHIDYYRDIYDENYWYLEISSQHASKYNAVMYLRKMLQVSCVYGFGDNFNDIPLFRACDACFAVKNAKPEICKLACEVIDSNNEDAVARKITDMVKDE
ncbi:MAG: HAD hydrolase family protein [Oscillospiraceae bacterium]|nr:HAD hydrolase family protein [Oscillospiraceae bacterium]